jgi:ribosomal protein S18 acetylase RimI-like enzyme
LTAAEEVSIRSFCEADRRGLVGLWTEVFLDDPPRNAPDRMIDGKLANHPELLLVAEAEGLIVGAVIAGYDGVRGWIYHLAVAQSHRRRGIATRLMHAATGGLRRAGCVKINLQVRNSNAAVVAFYRALGYEVEDRVSMGRALD